MAKILGLGENAHWALGGVFMLLFGLGLLSGFLSLVEHDVGNAVYVLGVCTVIGLIPGVIFLFFAARLAKERSDLERLGQFLAKKGRSTVAEVAAEFKWTEPDAEDKIVTALAENKVAGNFDRGTRQFYTEASMQNMEFVAKCCSCGASLGIWVSRTEAAKCSYCNSEPRPNFVPPPPPQPMIYGAQPGVPAQYGAPPPVGMPAYGVPAYGTPAYGMPGYGMPPYGVPAAPIPPPPQVTGTAPPSGQDPPAPPLGTRHVSPYPEGSPPPPPPAPRKKRTVKFLFFSMRSGALEVVGFTLFILGVLFLGAAIAISTTFWQGMFFTIVCSSVFYLPLLLIGGALIIRAYREQRYKNELLDIVDYIATYRRITVNLLARKMAIPEDKVRKIINDILEFELVEGYLTPDGSEFIISLRKEDVKTVHTCPYCRNPSINIQVLRGGSEKCPFCSGVIYFQEGL